MSQLEEINLATTRTKNIVIWKHKKIKSICNRKHHNFSYYTIIYTPTYILQN